VQFSLIAFRWGSRNFDAQFSTKVSVRHHVREEGVLWYASHPSVLLMCGLSRESWNISRRARRSRGKKRGRCSLLELSTKGNRWVGRICVHTPGVEEVNNLYPTLPEHCSRGNPAGTNSSLAVIHLEEKMLCVPWEDTNSGRVKVICLARMAKIAEVSVFVW